MKVLLDRDRCHLNGNCLDECPEVFALDDEDRVAVTVEEPSEDLRERIEFAAECCPRFAISVVD